VHALQPDGWHGALDLALQALHQVQAVTAQDGVAALTQARLSAEV
jgi:hypothetical protein